MKTQFLAKWNPLKWSVDSVLKWMILAFIIRGAMMLFFSFEFQNNWRPDLLHSGFVVLHNDTHGYFSPMESFIAGDGYSSSCRMPGLLPIYALIRVFFSPEISEIILVLIQFCASVITVYLLAKSAYLLQKSQVLFVITFFVAAFSSFISIWDQALLSDSLSVSFLIYSVYFALKYIDDSKKMNLVWSGVFLAWTVFVRPTHILLVPVLGLLILFKHWKGFKSFGIVFKTSIILFLPIVVSIAAWTYRNYSQLGRPVFLQDKNEVCFGALSEHYVSLRNMVIGWGGDYKGWSKNTELSWFLDKNTSTHFDFDQRIFTTQYNSDSLRLLKGYFLSTLDERADNAIRTFSENKVREMSLRYTASYKNEHPIDYYFFNRIRLIRLFVFQGNIENLPLPAMSQMNPFEKMVKYFYSILLIFVAGFFLISCLCSLISKTHTTSIVFLFPVLIIILIGAFFGYAEQRYLAPAYPFMVIGFAMLCTKFFEALTALRKQRAEV
jgi:hypothetical protein